MVTAPISTDSSNAITRAQSRAGEWNASFAFDVVGITTPTLPNIASTSESLAYSSLPLSNCTSGFCCNQQYSVTAITTSTGTIAERYAYTAYGQPTILNSSASALASSSLNQRFSYTGREWDATLGLHHFRARWMSPSAGRFLGRDPSVYADGCNTFSFVNNQSVNMVDPFGMEKCNPKLVAGKKQDIPINLSLNKAGLIYRYVHKGSGKVSFVPTNSSLTVTVGASGGSRAYPLGQWFGDFVDPGPDAFGSAKANLNCSISCVDCGIFITCDGKLSDTSQGVRQIIPYDPIWVAALSPSDPSYNGAGGGSISVKWFVGFSVQPLTTLEVNFGGILNVVFQNPNLSVDDNGINSFAWHCEAAGKPPTSPPPTPKPCFPTYAPPLIPR